MAITAPAVRALSLPTELPDSEPRPALIAIYNTFYFGGFFSLVGILVVATVSPNVRRAAIWYTFIMAWTVYCLPFLLIVGHQQGPPPDHTLCLAQAVFVYASAPMAIFACLGLMVQLYVSCTGLVMSRPAEANHVFGLLHVMPFFVYGVLVLEGFRVGSMTPEVVARDVSGMFCNFSSDAIRRTSSTLVMVGAFVVLWLQSCIVYVLYRNWHAFKRLGSCTTAPRSLVSLALILRAAIFCTLVVIGLVMGFLLCLYNGAEWTVLSSSKMNLVTATAPVGGAIIFGTQADILRAIFFRPRCSKCTFDRRLDEGAGRSTP
ncbi:hypothetical protein BDZ89DRAFT_485723 [Hymenopellis radicata]|nr:hypothetical protein BDZ89DRAFT_485723 [Hymenopellis radicata]